MYGKIFWHKKYNTKMCFYEKIITDRYTKIKNSTFTNLTEQIQLSRV